MHSKLEESLALQLKEDSEREKKTVELQEELIKCKGELKEMTTRSSQVQPSKVSLTIFYLYLSFSWKMI